MERPVGSRATQNQTARIWLIIGIFLDNLAAIAGFKDFVGADTPEGF
jgi:hypothetical protein